MCPRAGGDRRRTVRLIARGRRSAERGDVSLPGTPLPTIRVMLAEMPRLLRDLVSAAISSQPDMLVTDEVPDANVLADLVGRERPDGVVVGRPLDRLDPAHERVLWAHPRVRLLGLGDGRSAAVYALRPVRGAVPELTVASLLAEVRGACMESRA